MPAARGMAQFSQCFGFDLADAFPGDIEIPADLFQRVILAVDEAKPQLKHLPLAF